MIRLGIIGCGGMAAAQVDRFTKIKGCKVVACSDIAPGRAAEFAKKFKIPAAYEDTRQMLANEELDGVSVVTIDSAHEQPVLQAIKQGLHVMCEKPLSTTLASAKKMAAAAKRGKLITAVNFSYRNSPATQKAASLVASGKLGCIVHVEGSYLQSWLPSKVWGDWRTTEAWLWRLSTKHGSAGVMGDVGVHLYDLASFVVGDIKEIHCDLKTFKKDKKRIGPYVFDANDSAVASVRFANGAIGTLHTTRWATGYANTVSLRVFGEKGSLDLNLDRPAPQTLRVCLGKDVDKCVWKNAKCPKVPDMYQRFVTAIKTGKQGQTSFAGATKVQAYLDASFRSADKQGWVKVKV